MTDNQFRLPDVGEGLEEAEIVTWHVAVGDTVEYNQVLVEIETAKSIVELPSPFAGTVSVLHASEGETVTVGTAIISIASAGAMSTPHEEVSAGSTDGGAETAEPAPSVLVGYGPSEARSTRRRRTPTVAINGGGGTGQRPLVRAKPPVRMLAKELGVDLDGVAATGPENTITRGDVVRTAEAAKPQADTTPPPRPAPLPGPTPPRRPGYR